MESVLQKLKAHLTPEAKSRQVVDVRLGLGYTAVQLDDGQVGVAFTYQDAFGGGCTVFGGLRPLAGRPADLLLSYLDSSQSVEAAVGLATANALANRSRPDYFLGDSLDALNVTSSDRVGMIGYFAPLMARLKSEAAEVIVFETAERDLLPGDVVLPAEAAHERLADCQVALVTATALINGTMEGILASVRHCREVVILGSSTPLCEAAFEGTPVTLLSGIVADNPGGLLQVVSEGGGTRAFKGLVQKVNIRL